MRFWDLFRQQAQRGVRAILRMFRRQTVPIHPLPVVSPKQFIPPPLPGQRTVHEGGLRIDVLSREPDFVFPFQVYAEAFNKGPARDAEWTHIITADRQLAHDALQHLIPSSPLHPSDLPRGQLILHSIVETPLQSGGR